MRVGDQVIARDREADRLLAVGEDVDQDEGVRVLAADAAGVQHHLHVVIQLPALEISPALQPHHQDVHRAERGAAADRDALAERCRVPDDLVGIAGDHENHGRGEAGPAVPGLARNEVPKTSCGEHCCSFLRRRRWYMHDIGCFALAAEKWPYPASAQAR
jgi:hypothetical protein